MVTNQRPLSEPAKRVRLDPVDDPRWDALVADAPGRLFLTRRWMQCLRDTYGFTAVAETLVDEASGRLVGGLPYVIVDDLRGERLVSLPFSDMTEPIAADEMSWRLLSTPLFQMELPITLRTFAHPIVCADRRFTTALDIVHHAVDCTPEPDTLLAGFSASTRQRIRAAERAGLQVSVRTDAAAVDAFYRLHLQTRRVRHQLLAQSPEWFHCLREAYLDAGDGAIILAHRDGEAHGAVFVVDDGDTSYYKFAATSEEGRADGASHACLFGAIRYAHERGATTLDLGRTDADHEGLIAFKRRFRPTERPLAVHRAGNSRPQDLDAGRTLGALTALLVDERVPDEITSAAGALLYRYFA